MRCAWRRWRRRRDLSRDEDPRTEVLNAREDPRRMRSRATVAPRRDRDQGRRPLRCGSSGWYHQGTARISRARVAPACSFSGAQMQWRAKAGKDCGAIGIRLDGQVDLAKLMRVRARCLHAWVIRGSSPAHSNRALSGMGRSGRSQGWCSTIQGRIVDQSGTRLAEGADRFDFQHAKVRGEVIRGSGVQRMTMCSYDVQRLGARMRRVQGATTVEKVLKDHKRIPHDRGRWVDAMRRRQCPSRRDQRGSANVMPVRTQACRARHQ